MFCKEVSAIVNGLKDEYEDVHFVLRSAQDDVGKQEVKKYDLGRHGMVILDPQGQQVWTKPGHRIEKEEIVDALNQYALQ